MDRRRGQLGRPLTVAALAVAVGVGAAACGSGRGDAGAAPTTDSAVDDDRPVVLTTFTVLADMARNVAGDHLRVESITDVGAEIHGYEPTPEDLRRAAGADLVLDNGLGLEAWFAQFVADVDAEHVVLSDGVKTIAIAGEDGVVNPHAWMSPSGGQVYVDNIVEALSDLDPAHAGDFAANGAAYAAELEELRVELVESLRALPPDQRVLVTCEGAFSYLARDAGLAEAYLWPVNSERQSTPRQVAAVIDRVRAEDVPAVFCESTVNGDAQRQVAAETGARYGGTLFVDSLSGPGGPVPTYLDLLRHDAATIVTGLTGEDLP
ncbi:metal ABC transporter substrate-binding protein [Georgenia subflava]|uniref:Metal ABC transporter substrate-binding protein n=1 Tax=Georgenia subflava TaxID=1622177 RepID=A0A6N7EJU1_9MICO|nr:metal ABC transporter substrate-binding protein [Georgenia subflava]MPV37348.1 metal ABC transporter substrate-binding protein [Georgenia subflava]